MGRVKIKEKLNEVQDFSTEQRLEGELLFPDKQTFRHGGVGVMLPL